MKSFLLLLAILCVFVAIATAHDTADGLDNVVNEAAGYTKGGNKRKSSEESGVNAQSVIVEPPVSAQATNTTNGTTNGNSSSNSTPVTPANTNNGTVVSVVGLKGDNLTVCYEKFVGSVQKEAKDKHLNLTITISALDSSAFNTSLVAVKLPNNTVVYYAVNGTNAADASGLPKYLNTTFFNGTMNSTFKCASTPSNPSSGSSLTVAFSTLVAASLLMASLFF
jgi:hypothetical protein